MASNTGTTVDPDYGQSADWIELYNAGTSAVNLNGYYLTDNLKTPNKWKITNISIAAKGYALFWADSKDSANHTSFNLSATLEEIGLYRPDLTVVDSLSYGLQDPNISMGRKGDGNIEWALFIKATPGATNNTINYTGIVKSDPSFSIPGGIYKNPVTLEIKTIFGGSVLYTLDGTEPDETSAVVSAPFSITENTVVRTRIYKPGEILGPIITNTYLIDTENKINKLPVFCISSDPVNFWDPVKGIYEVHPSKPLWEIPVNVELYENDGRPGAAFNVRAGIKSTGLYSWQLPEKMLGVSLRKEYGFTKIEYPLIYDKERRLYSTFSLRASGSDWGNTMFRDGMIQSSASENTSLDINGFRASVVFVNGEYMGVHNIREKIDANYIEGNYGLAEGTFDMIEETDQGHYAETGDFTANDYFLSLVAQDLTVQANYDALASVMDIDEFTELVCAEVFSGNNSIGHNLMKWKPKDSGKWKWILMDFDRGFFGAGNELISFYINEDGWPLKELIRNPDFKKQFGLKLSDLIFTTFNTDRMLLQIEDHQKTIEAEMPNHIARWEGTRGTGNYSGITAISSMDYWFSEVQELRTFAQARPGVILNDLMNYGFQAPVPVSITTYPAGSGKLTFNGLKIPVDVCNGGYPKGESIKLTAEANSGYTFLGWKANEDTLLIGKQTSWKYLDKGSDPGPYWKNADYSDAFWKSGQAELGYGDGGEKTVISYGGNTSNRYITSWFRKNFTYNSKQDVIGLSISLNCDDGAVIYLNGNEIQRYNMPGGVIDAGTTAIVSISGTDETTFHNFSVGPDFLINGTNTISVEVHQAAANSSDLSFDMELTANLSGNSNYLSTAKELLVNSQTALNISAVFESDGKCLLPAEISTALTLSKACSPYIVGENVNITSAGSLIIEPGVELWMSDGVSFSSFGPIIAKGTKNEPVIFRSNPQSAEQKWGNISIKNASDTCWFKNVIIENASEGPNPVRDIAALAVSGSVIYLDSVSLENIYKNPLNFYDCQTILTNSRLHSEFAGVDLINIKKGKILMSHCEFYGNSGLDSDALDFGDMTENNSIVSNCYFHDLVGFNSDAVDLGDHSKNILVDSIVVYNMQDKGVSIGQQSSAKITNSVFINCGMGAGMKDSSNVIIDNCTYYGNVYAIANYQKHAGDAGANASISNSILSNSYESGYLSDEFSNIKVNNSSDDTEKLPDGFNNLFANPLFTDPNKYDFSLMPGSALIGAGTNGSIGASLKLPTIPLSPIISDIAYVTQSATEDLEFIGLFNPAEYRIHLDSCMFTSGLTFTFPVGSYIEAREKVFVASNAASAFWTGRNVHVFQWEIGRLSDQGEKIQLVNKYGKIIDQVIFGIADPWPVPLNSLQGITLNRFEVDNHFGENWKVTPINVMFIEPAISKSNLLSVYPNPASDILSIEVKGSYIPAAGLYSLLGQLVKEIRLETAGITTIDVSDLQNGIYVVKAGNYTSKVVIAR
jgi:hypothetical protein